METLKITTDTLEAALVLLMERDGFDGLNTNEFTASAGDLRQAVVAVHGLERLAGQLSASAVFRCNYPMTDVEAARRGQREVRLVNKALALVEPFGASLITGGDPRGSQLRIATPKSRRHNTWGGAESGFAL